MAAELLTPRLADAAQVAQLRVLAQNETGTRRPNPLTEEDFLENERRRHSLRGQLGGQQTTIYRAGDVIVSYLDWEIQFDHQIGRRSLYANGFTHPGYRLAGFMTNALRFTVDLTCVRYIRTSVPNTAGARGLLQAAGLSVLPYTRLERVYDERAFRTLEVVFGWDRGPGLRLPRDGDYCIHEAEPADVPVVSSLLHSLARSLERATHREYLEHGVEQLVTSPAYRHRHGFLFVLRSGLEAAGTFRLIPFFNTSFGGWEVMFRDVVLAPAHHHKRLLPWLVHGGMFLARAGQIPPDTLARDEAVLGSTYVLSEPWRVDHYREWLGFDVSAEVFAETVAYR